LISVAPFARAFPVLGQTKQRPNIVIVLADNLIDFSDLFPALCELTGAPMPKAEIHGRSLASQLLGKPGHPRESVRGVR
jgi:hypothetical protein